MDAGERVWILDTESNGENPGEIVELAAVEMVGLVLTGRYREWRFRPRQPVHYRATRVHGITDRALVHCPRIEERAHEIRTLLGTHAIAGHAVHVEVAALQRVLPGWEPPRAYDTLRMSRRAFPDLTRHRLSAMGDHLDLSVMAARLSSKKAHSAFYDALLCGLILRHMVDPLDVAARTAMLEHAEIMGFRRERDRRQALKAAKADLRRKLKDPS